MDLRSFLKSCDSPFHQKLFIWSENCDSLNFLPGIKCQDGHTDISLEVHVLILLVPAVAHGQVHVLPLHARPLSNVQGVLIKVDTSHLVVDEDEVQQ